MELADFQSDRVLTVTYAEKIYLQIIILAREEGMTNIDQGLTFTDIH